MGKGMTYASRRGRKAVQEIVKEVIKVDALTIEVDGASGIGFGTLPIGDFPEGNILFLGAVAYMQFTGPGSASLDDNWEGDFSVGSTATADSTLGGTDVDIVASTALAAATSEVSPRTRGTGATQAVLDNTDGSLEINLNLIVDDANIGADDLDFTVTGELHIAYIVLGDD